MNLDRTTVIAGLPIKAVRDAIREMDRLDNHGWALDDLAVHMKISVTNAEWLCETLRERGVLVTKPQPEGHERGVYYTLSETGTRFTNARMLKRIDRARVDQLLAGLLERVREINADNDLCYFINEIRLCGSAMDGKTNSFGDIDIGYVMARRKRPPAYKDWTDWNLSRANASGRHHTSILSRFNYVATEVLRRLKKWSPYISLHDLDDVIGIGPDSIRLFIAPEGALEADDGGTSGEALSQASMQAATGRAERKAKGKTSAAVIGGTFDESPKERMISAVRSLAFDLLGALDESTSPEALERSIHVAHERTNAYHAANGSERVADKIEQIVGAELVLQPHILPNR
jgi:hypothetical protein